MNKTLGTFLGCAAALALIGCGESQQTAAPEPAAPVQGQAIAKLDAEPAAPETPAETTPAQPAAMAPFEVQTAAPEPVATKPAEVKPAPVAAPVAKQAVEETVKKVAENVVAKATETKPAAAKPEMVDGEFLAVGFDRLSSFEYEVPDEEYDPDKKPDPAKQTNQIPAEIQAFNKKRIALKGFMLPLKVEDGNITELLIMRDQSMCCYGTVPKINEWVSVKMTGKGVKPIMDQAVTIYGRLKVGEIRENGYLVGIYEMDGEKMTGPLDL